MLDTGVGAGGGFDSTSRRVVFGGWEDFSEIQLKAEADNVSALTVEIEVAEVADTEGADVGNAVLFSDIGNVAIFPDVGNC